jgi:hypothetical protein
MKLSLDYVTGNFTATFQFKQLRIRRVSPAYRDIRTVVRDPLIPYSGGIGFIAHYQDPPRRLRQDDLTTCTPKSGHQWWGSTR